MSFKERFQEVTQKTKRFKEFWLRLADYENNMKLWQKNTLGFLSKPIEIPTDNSQRLTLNLTQEPPEEKAKIIDIILRNRQTLHGFYCMTYQYAEKNDTLGVIDCVSYATFVATFAKWMNPQNETTIFMGSARVSDCPDKEKINTRSDHFWTEINGEIFDNSGGLDGYFYTDLQPLIKSQDILSGNFHFKRIV
jgi:hypothetical protein